jgi:hypothetical protein
MKEGSKSEGDKENPFHIFQTDTQRQKLEGFGNSKNYNGGIISGIGKQGYVIRFDELPVGEKYLGEQKNHLISCSQ